jgi:GT2 family glycosyltransferase
MTDVSIIIVNYNTCNLTAACIESIRRHVISLRYEIIVIDNASTDGSRAYFTSLEELTYIYSTENVGFGRGNNLGLRYAVGRNILFLNSDTLIEDDSIRVLSDYLDNHPRVGACGGNLFAPDRTPVQSFMRIYPSIFWEIDELLHSIPTWLLYRQNRYHNHTDYPLRVAYIVGADLMIPRRILDQIGGFDPRFFMYYEETELCRRIRNAGLEIIVLPDARIIHLEGGSQNNRKLNVWKIKQMLVSRRLYFQITHTSLYRWFADQVLYIKIHSRLFCTLFIRKDDHSRWLETLKQYKAL